MNRADVPGSRGAAGRLSRPILGWFILTLLVWPFASLLGRHVEPASAVDGAESSRVEAALGSTFGSAFARSAVLVLPDLERASSDDGRARVRAIVALIDTLPFVTGIVSPATSLDTLLTGAGGTGAAAIVGVDATVQPAAAIDALRRATAGLAADGMEALWTGRIALDTDLRRISAVETRRAELRAVPPSMLLAVWAFGGLGAALAGVGAGMLVVGLALALTAFIAFMHPVTVLAPGIASLLGLAVGIDYALLIMRGGPVSTVRLAGLAAAAGFAPLLFVPVAELRSAGIAALAAIVAAVLVAGGWVTRVRSAAFPQADGWAAGTRNRWSDVVRAVVRNPFIALTIALPPLLVLAGAASRLEVGLHDTRSLPGAMESARALDRLTDMGRAGAALGLRTIVTLPPGQTVFEPRGWQTLSRVEDELLADPRIADVRSITTASGGVPPADVKLVFPESGLRTFTSRDETRALIEIIPAASLDARGAAQLVRDLRRRRGPDIDVGGAPAWSVDYADAIASHALPAALLAVGAAFVVLLVAFRSVLLAAKAILLNLLSAGAAIGATVLVFQDGMGARLFGVTTPLGGLFPTVPLLAFCAVFGIGMDYEVFLLASVFNARRKGATLDNAIVDGVASSAPLITRAATIMVAVFVAFAAGDFIAVRMVGFALAIAVLLDATAIRLVVAPALMRVAGRWNWWPGERALSPAGNTPRHHVVQSAP